MSGYNPGKMRLIEEWLPDEPKQSGLRWFKRARLSCGHIVMVPIGMSPSHKKKDGKYIMAKTRCVDCFKAENNL